MLAATAVAVTAVVTAITLALRDDHVMTWINGHEGVAAWVQAIGSVLAILAAITVAAWQSREGRLAILRQLAVARREKIEPLRAMGAIASEAVQEAVNRLKPGTASKDYFSGGYSPILLRDMIEALDKVPLHELGDFDLVRQFTSLRRMIATAKRMLDRMSKEIDVQGISPESIATFTRLADKLVATQAALSTRAEKIETV